MTGEILKEYRKCLIPKNVLSLVPAFLLMYPILTIRLNDLFIRCTIEHPELIYARLHTIFL